jgi:hypothetical protein
MRGGEIWEASGKRWYVARRRIAGEGTVEEGSSSVTSDKGAESKHNNQ